MNLLLLYMCVTVCVCVCVCACVRACVRACVCVLMQSYNVLWHIVIAVLQLATVHTLHVL